jgi:prophage regulatory protein
MISSPKILDLPTVQEKTSCGRSFVYQGIKDGTFPRQIRLGTRRIGFLESDIDEWIAARVKESCPELREARQ